MAQTGKPRSGKAGKIRIGGTDIYLKIWEVDDVVEDLDTTHFECGGFAEGVVGIYEATVSFQGDWHANQNPYSNPPSLKRGEILGDVKLYTNFADGQHYNFPFLRIIQSRLSCPVRGTVTYSAVGKSDGPYVEPQENV